MREILFVPTGVIKYSFDIYQSQQWRFYIGASIVNIVKLFNCATKRKGSFLSAWPELYSP